MTDILRYLSYIERFFWLSDQVEPSHFSVSAQVEGTTAVEEWTSALSALQRRHPFLSASIKADDNGAPYFHREPEVQIPLRVTEGDTLDLLNAEVARELATPFRKGTAPLLRAVLLHEKQRSIIILVTHHSIADALSLVYAIRDLVQALSGKSLSPLPVPPSHEKLLGLAEGSESNGKSAGPTASTPSRFFKMRPQVTSLLLARDETKGLKERAHQEQTTIHGALASSVVFASSKLSVKKDQAPLRLMSPISTRKQLDQGEDCVVLTDAGILELNVPSSNNLWELARQIKNDLSPLCALDHITKSRGALQQVPAGRQPMDVDFVLSNMGNLPIQSQYGGLKIEAVWGPSILISSLESQHVIGVAGINGSISLLYSSLKPIPLLLETMKAILVEACLGRHQ